MFTVPRIWLLLFLLHAGAGVVAWRCGWWPGLLVMMTVHLLLLASTLWTGSTFFCPARRRFSWSDRAVVLTIDDGPCADTPAMLDLLEAHQAKAVFFLIGNRATAHPEWVQGIAARGHAVENHSFTHPAKTFWAYGPSRQRREMEKTNRVLTEIAGRYPNWFRAPAGFRNPFTGAVLRVLGMNYMGWAARGLDTSDANIPRVLARLRRGFRPGAVLLVHQGHPHSVAVLRALLEALRKDGWSTRLPAADPVN